MITRIRAGRRRQLGIGLLAFVVLLGAAAGGLAAWSERSSRVPLALGKGHYSVRVVSNEVAREKGLSGTEQLAEDKGMLFVFDTDDHWGIWMKDMNYPIDILWLDQSKTVIDMVANATPESYPTIFKPKQPARYVLELASGSAARAAIAVGSRATFDVAMPGRMEL
jgi:uncharacterized membrane protein (UPF0127 family)